MSFFSRIFQRADTVGSVAFRRKRAEQLHGQIIKYVTERKGDNEDVVGRGGSLAVHGDEFIVDSSGDTLFRCKVDQLDAAYLMSGDGVILTGPNLLEAGKIRTVTVHFVYYRK